MNLNELQMAMNGRNTGAWSEHEQLMNGNMYVKEETETTDSNDGHLYLNYDDTDDNGYYVDYANSQVNMSTSGTSNWSESVSRPKERLNRSPVWKYGEKFVENGKLYMRCKQESCEYRVPYNNTTRPLTNHLLTVHNIRPYDEDESTHSEQVQARPVVSNRQARLDADLVCMALLRFLASDYQPLSLVENRHLRELMGLMNKEFKPPSEKQLAGVFLDRAFGQCVDSTRLKLDQAGAITVGCETWPHDDFHGYLSVTAHFFDCDFNFHSCSLGVEYLIDQPVQQAIKNALVRIFLKWNVISKIRFIVTDRSDNMTNAVDLLNVELAAYNVKPIEHFGCLGELINSIVQPIFSAKKDQAWKEITLDSNEQQTLDQLNTILAKCKHIVAVFNHSNESNNECLTGEKSTQSIPPVTNHWHSGYLMIERLLGQYDQVEAIVKSQPFVGSEASLSPDEKRSLYDLLDVLGCFDYAVKLLSDTKYNAMSYALPLSNSVLEHLKPCDDDSVVKNRLKSILTRATNRQLRKSPFENETQTVCTFLDPRMKHFLQFSLEQRAQFKNTAFKTIREFVHENKIIPSDERNPNVESVDDHPQPPVKRPKFNIFDFNSEIVGNETSAKSQSNRNALLNELDNYVNEAHLNVDIYAFWKQRAKQYPILANVIKCYVSLVATSVPAIWLFTDLGNQLCSRRNSLTPTVVHKMTLINENNF